MPQRQGYFQALVALILSDHLGYAIPERQGPIMRQLILRVIIAAITAGIVTCQLDNNWSTDGDGDSDGDGDGDPCIAGEPFCSSDGRQVIDCVEGVPQTVYSCPPEQTCVSGVCSVVVCAPGQIECVDSHTERLCQADGLGWQERPCGEGLRCFDETPGCGMACVLRVFILLDRSGSMGGEESPTKWEQAREALAALMSSSTAQEVEFGLGVFPTGGDCGTSSQVVYPVPEATAENVDAYFTTYSPDGNTPLLDAMNFHLDDASANLSDPAYSNFVLLVSDGSDTCYEENCLAQCGIFNPFCIINCEERSEQEVINLIGQAAATLRDEASIRTFVIGFGSGVSDEELTAVADNGGTVLGRWLPASNIDELQSAFDTILGEMLECNPIVY